MKDLVRQLNAQIAAEAGDTPPAPKRRIRRRATPADTGKAPKAAKRVVKAAPPKGKELTYNRVAFGLTGNKTRAYTVAVLRVLGVLTAKRPAFRRRALSSFFACDSLIRYHKKQGNLEEVEAGTIRLTDTGLEFFRERKELKEDVATFEAAIRTGEDCGYRLRSITIVK